MSYIGDYAAGDTLDFKFTTYRPSTGAAYTLGGTPALSVYKSNSTTQSTAGVTLTADFDAVTGLNHARIDTTSDGSFYADGGQFDVVITTGTVDSVSVVGAVVGRFTLRAQAALYPTTAGRKLDVSSGGEAGVDWANVGSPTTTVNLSGTTIKTATDVETDTADLQTRIPAALVSGRIDASVGAMAANVLTATAIASDAITDAKVASDVTIASVTGSVGSVTGLTPSTIADQVWDEILSGHSGVGSTGAALAAAGGSGDPWATALPGAYGAGTAGQIVGDYLDAAVSGISGLDAAGVRAAVGLASANLDTQLAALPTATENADALLNRDMSAVSDTNARSPLNALRFLRNKWDVSGTALTVKKEDDSTTAWTSTVTAAPGADPISGSDPT